MKQDYQTVPYVNNIYEIIIVCHFFPSTRYLVSAIPKWYLGEYFCDRLLNCLIIHTSLVSSSILNSSQGQENLLLFS